MRLSQLPSDPIDFKINSTIRMPIYFPEFTACVHIRNETGWPESWGRINNTVFNEIENTHKKILLVGDVNYINPKIVRKHLSFSMSTPERNAIMAGCACRGKVFYGNEWSSLSANMCMYASKCHLINRGKTSVEHERHLVKFRKINTICFK